MLRLWVEFIFMILLGVGLFCLIMLLFGDNPISFFIGCILGGYPLAKWYSHLIQTENKKSDKGV